MRAWYVFVVVGLILSAGMVTYGVMLKSKINQDYQRFMDVQNLTPVCTPTPVNTPLTNHPQNMHSLRQEAKQEKSSTIEFRLNWGNSTNINKYHIPKNYYRYPFKKYRPTYANLIKLLDSLRCPHKYNPRTFKCTHYAAWLEWYLENHGFRTDVVVVVWRIKGTNPPQFTGHALDEVYTVDHGVVYIDPTILIIPWAHGKDLIIKSPTSEIPSNAENVTIKVYPTVYSLLESLGYNQINWWDTLGYPPKVN